MNRQKYVLMENASLGTGQFLVREKPLNYLLDK
jgi:hypothetical protein